MIDRLRKKPESRRYLLRVAVAMVLYFGSLYAAELLIEDGGMTGWPAYVLAGLPGLAFAALFWIFVRLIVEERDEFIRMLYVRQMLVATGIALTAAAIWGFMETYLPVPHVEAYWWPTLWAFGTGIGAVYNKITMGTYGECA